MPEKVAELLCLHEVLMANPSQAPTITPVGKQGICYGMITFYQMLKSLYLRNCSTSKATATGQYDELFDNAIAGLADFDMDGDILP
jgi:hypothetical protein